MKRIGLLLLILIAVFTTSAQTNEINNDNPYVIIPLTVAQSHTTVTIDLQAVSGDLDTLLYLTDGNGVILAENDDRIPREDTNSQIVYANIPAGEYQIIATRYGILKDGSSGEFELNITQTETVSQPDYANITLENFPRVDTQPQATWTILAYYGADTNLEGAILNDFDEFEQAGGSDETVRIIALVDRHDRYDETNDNWTTARIYEVGADQTGDYIHEFMPPTATIDTVPLMEIGEVDTSSGDVLAQFLLWGIENYPAEHYAIAFGSHGAGWQGIVTDDASGKDIISAPELRAALEVAQQAAGVERFDLLINDACSMSSIEYYEAVSPYFALSYASPEIVVDPALNMTDFVNALKADPEVDLTILGEALIQTYIERDVQLRPGTDRAYMTHAVTDLQSFTPVTDAVEQFATLINADPVSYSTLLGLARTNTYTYTRALNRDEDTLIDLGSFMQQVIALSNDVEVIRAARVVLKSLEVARQYAEAGERAAPYISYYNIYFPPERAKFDSRYLTESGLTEWGVMLRNYYNTVNPTPWLPADSTLTYHPPVTPQVTVTQLYPDVSSTAFPPVAHIQIVGRRLSQGAFIVDHVDEQGRTVRLVSTDILTEVLRNDEPDLINQWRSGVDLSYFSWLPMSIPVVTDGDVSYNELLYRSGDLATLNGRYQISEDEWQDVAVVFSTDGTFAGVVSRDAETGSLASVDIPDNIVFQSYVSVVQSDGTIKQEPGNTYTWRTATRLTWRDDPTPPGEYELGFLVVTFGGLVGYDSVTVEVEASDNRGYTDLELGIAFQHPVEWVAVTDFGDQLVTQGDDATMRVYYFASESDTLDAEELSTRYGLDVALDSNGEFELGRAIYHAGHWIILTADTADAFQMLTDSLILFDPPGANADWGYNFITPRSTYPAPAAWNASIDGDWTIWSPEENSQTFIAVARLSSEAADASAMLDSLMETYAPVEDVTRQLYIGEFHRWESAAYTIERDGVMFIGRMYVTRRNGQYFAYRFETPDNDEALSILRGIFEPMIDGFAPPPAQVFSVGGLDDAYLRAALSITSNVCQDAAVGTICYGEGSVTVTGVDGFDAPGDTVHAIEVETLETDAESTAMIKAGAVIMTVLGDTRIINNTAGDPNLLNELEVINSTATRINIRAEPNTNGAILGSAGQGERLQAIGRNPAGDWVLVRVDDRRNGWVFASLVTPQNGAIADLRIALRNVVFTPMRSIDVELTPDSNGILIRVAYGQPAQLIEINGALFEIAPGTLFYWRENLEVIGSADATDTTLKRRPASWSADVVSGSIRVSLVNPLTNREEIVTSIGGTSIKLGTGGGMNLSRGFATHPGGFDDLPDIISEEEFVEFVEGQDEFTDLDFDLLGDEDYFDSIFEFEDDETDSDGDGWYDWEDNCPFMFNPPQGDNDDDGIGNICDENPNEYDDFEGEYWDDSDGDGWDDWEDNCPFTYNPDQEYICGDDETDSDDDGWYDWEDNCPYTYNPDQDDICGGGEEYYDTDSDGDGLSDDIDECPYEWGDDGFGCPVYEGEPDSDGDGLSDDIDECPYEWGDDGFGCPQ